MRNRKKQKIFKKLREKGISPLDETGLPDPTPFEAVKSIIEDEKKMIRRMGPEELKRYYREVLNHTD